MEIIIAIAALAFGTYQLFANRSIRKELDGANSNVCTLKKRNRGLEEYSTEVFELFADAAETLSTLANVLTKADVKKYNKKLKKYDIVITHETDELIDENDELVKVKYNAVSRISEIDDVEEVCTETCEG